MAGLPRQRAQTLPGNFLVLNSLSKRYLITVLQHRFVKGLALTAGDAAQEVLKGVGLAAGETVSSFIGLLKGIFGDYLKEF